MPILRHALSRLRRRSPDVLGLGLAALYGRAALGIATLSPEGRVLSCNPAFCRMMGYDAPEMEGHLLEDLIYSDDRRVCVDGMAKVRQGLSEHFEIENRFVCKDGKLGWARIMVAALPQDICEGVLIAAAVDITDCRRMSDRFCALYRRTPAIMHSTDRSGSIVDVSDLWERSLGYPRGEALGRPVLDFLSSESRRSADGRAGVHLSLGEAQDVPMQFVRKDGTLIDALVSATSEKDGNGEIVRCYAVLQDVTERKKAEEQVRRLTAELEERVAQRTALLAAQQETSPDGILVVDIHRRILSHNRRFLEMWGLSEEVLATRSDHDAIRAVIPLLAEPESFEERIVELYTHPDEKSLDEIKLKDGRVFERHSSPIAGPHGRRYGRVWYFRDITWRVEKERALLEKTAELARSNADVQMYAFGASHDLATQVRKISNFAALLERRAAEKLDGEERGMLARMRGAAERLSGLIKEVLALSSIGRESGPPERVDVAAVVAELLEDYGMLLLETGTRVKVGELPVIRAHRRLVYRLMENLLSNAIKYRRESVPCRVLVASRLAEGGVEIVVKDNGIGFEPRFAAMIFEPFTRLHPPSVYRGNGMGLALCQRVAARYGGRLSAHGVPGKGATFVVWLPDSVVARGPAIS